MAAGKGGLLRAQALAPRGGAVPPRDHRVPARVVARALRELVRARDHRRAATSPRTHEIRDLLRRSGVPHGFSRPRLASGARSCSRTSRRTRPGDPSSAFATAPCSSIPPTSEIVKAFGVGTEVRGAPGLRPRDRRRRAGRVVRGGLRGLGGAAHARDRARHDRRPGGFQLADPQLPRVRARRHRRRARPAGLSAGVGVRGRVRDQPRGRRAGARSRAVRGRLRRRLHRHRSRAPARHRGQLRADRDPWAGGALRRRRLLRRVDVEGLGLEPRTSTSSAAATRPARPPCICRAPRRGCGCWCAAARSAADMSQYLRRDDRARLRTSRC